MNEFVLAIVAVVGTLLGGVIAFVAQSRVSANQIAEARYDRRRDDFVAAATALAAAITKLLQGEYNRAKLRLDNVPTEKREPARQATYDRRSDAQLAQFRFQIISDPAEDQLLVTSVEKVIKLCREVTDSPTNEALTRRHRAAKEAASNLISDVNVRADNLYTRRRGARQNKLHPRS